MAATTRKAVVIGAIAIALVGCGSSNATDAVPAGATPAKSSTTSSSAGTLSPTLRSTIATTLKIDESKVTPGASFAGDLGADELSMVELVMAYERVFKVDIPDADADRFKQVQDVVSYLQKRNALR